MIISIPVSNAIMNPFRHIVAAQTGMRGPHFPASEISRVRSDFFLALEIASRQQCNRYHE